MKFLVQFGLVSAQLALLATCSPVVAADVSDADSFFGTVKAIEKSMPLDTKRVNDITKLPLRNWSAGQVKSAYGVQGGLLRVEGGLDEKAQLITVSLVPGVKAHITPDQLKACFGDWTGQRAKPTAWNGNPKPVVYFYECPWGDIDFEFAALNKPPMLTVVHIVPYKREKASDLSRRSKVTTGAK